LEDSGVGDGTYRSLAMLDQRPIRGFQGISPSYR
jgi:hypothetical protein